MSITRIQTLFAPIKRWTPSFIWVPLRAVLTAILTPALFAISTGHFRSSILRRAVSRNGLPIPWYTYPCIDLLATRNLSGRRVLEAGAGQSTLWWARRAATVLSLEEDKEWYEALRKEIPSNVSLCHISMDSVDRCLEDVANAVRGQEPFDIIVIDGLHRAPVLHYLISKLSPDGAIICDNAEGYGFFAELQRNGLTRIDFFGFAPGVVNRHCTSIAYRKDCFLFCPDVQIPRAVDIRY